MATWPTMTVQADWQHTPNSGLQTWTNLQSAGNTAVTGFRTRRGRQYETNKVEAGTAEIDVVDLSEYLNPANASSPWNSGSNTLTPYRQCRIQATWSGTTYNVFNGYVERFPVAWDSAGFRGVRQLACVDALALLNRTALQPQRQETITGLSPLAYWPLSDQAGTPTTGMYRETTGSVTTPWVQNVTDVPAPGFGAASTLPVPDGLTVLQAKSDAGDYTNSVYTGLYPGFTFNGYTRNLTSGLSVTLSAWLAIKDLTAGGNPAPATSIVLGTPPNGNNLLPYVQVGIQDLAAAAFLPYVQAFVQASDNGQVHTVGPLTGSNYALAAHGTAVHFAAVITQASSTTIVVTLYLDGQQQLTSSTVLFNAANFTSLQLIGVAGTAASTLHSFSDFAVWNSALTAAQIADIAASGATGWAGEPTVYNSASAAAGRGRAKRIIDASSFVGYGTALDDQNTSGHGGQTQQAAALGWGGKTVRTLLENSTQTEDAVMYVGGDGKLTIKDRQSRRVVTASLYTFGDGTGELPYEGDVSFSLDPTYIFNDVTVNNSDGGVAEVTDSTSQTSYGVASTSLSGDFQIDNDALLRAQWVLAKYKTPVLRVEKITVDPGGNNALFPAALSLEIGNVVTVKRRNAGVTMSATYFVEAVEHDVAPGQWLTSFWLSPTSFQFPALTLDDATYGALDVYPVSN